MTAVVLGGPIAVSVGTTTARDAPDKRGSVNVARSLAIERWRARWKDSAAIGIVGGLDGAILDVDGRGDPGAVSAGGPGHVEVPGSGRLPPQVVLPYDMGNAGDLLKHGVLSEVARWQCEQGIQLRFIDLFGGEPWEEPVSPEVARRVRGFATASALCTAAPEQREGGG